MDNKQKQKYDRYHTEKQWRSFGYALKKDAKEVRLFTPSRNYTYFSPDDVVFQPELCKLVSKLEYDISVKYDIISRQDHNEGTPRKGNGHVGQTRQISLLGTDV